MGRSSIVARLGILWPAAATPMMAMTVGLMTGPVWGQSSAAVPEPVSSRPAIPPPRHFGLNDPVVRRARTAAEAAHSTQSDQMAAPAVPSVVPLPGAGTAGTTASPDSRASTPPPPPHLPIDTALIPGQVVEPIDLANAFKLAGVGSLDIAIARQRVLEATAELSQARALWLPSLFFGPTWYRSDGQIQTVDGQVQTISRSALFLGGETALANTFPGPPPGTGIPSMNGFSSVLRISDAIFEPMAARRVLQANQAGVRTAINDAMLQVAEAYFDLQAATGRLAIAREAAANAEGLAQITGAYARLGQGLEADHSRAKTELRHRQKEIHLASGQMLVASAKLARLLVLNPRIVFAPAEPAECIIRLIPDDVPLEDLVVQGLKHRPELANAQELVNAALVRWKQAKLRPFVPSVAVTYGGGGLGGGQNAFFGNFGPRGDALASLFWELQSLGFTDLAIMRQRAAQHQTARLKLVRMQTRVAEDVVAANATRQAALRQIEDSRKTLVEALDSLKLNFLNIRQGAELPRATRPIEVLQPIQALAQARLDYLDSVLDYNRAQFQLIRAIGRRP